jgi:hypothetical protein
MWTLLLKGGFPMWFLLVFGSGTLIFATRYARAPTRSGLRVTLSLGAATFLTILTAICTAFAAVGHHATEYMAAHPGTTLPEVLLQGMAESLSPGILGFTMLSLAALITTLGLYRAQGS